jgi:hypothetical protein
VVRADARHKAFSSEITRMETNEHESPVGKTHPSSRYSRPSGSPSPSPSGRGDSGVALRILSRAVLLVHRPAISESANSGQTGEDAPCSQGEGRIEGERPQPLENRPRHASDSDEIPWHWACNPQRGAGTTNVGSSLHATLQSGVLRLTEPRSEGRTDGTAPGGET